MTGALASENAGRALNNPLYDDARLQAYRVTLGLESNTLPGVKSAGLALSHGGARDTDLANSTTQSTQTRVVNTPGATQTWQDTYAATTTTRFVG